MQTPVEIQSEMEALKQQYGEWTYDIPLPFGIWTRGNLQHPHTRLRRIVQTVADLVQKPLSECRVLDLACLDGLFSIEFAKHGAETVGVEIREANINKAIFCKEALGLDNLRFRQDDVRNISVESYGRFDAIVCSGILYHLPAADVIKLIDRMYEMAGRVVVIDTHIALEPIERGGDGEYWGKLYREHSDDATPDEKAKKLWASADNATSFWFTRPSLVNILNKAGFTSVYECFSPVHLDNWGADTVIRDRCTFVALKGNRQQVETSPAVNGLVREFPEHSLGYCPAATVKAAVAVLFKKVLRRVRRVAA